MDTHKYHCGICNSFGSNDRTGLRVHQSACRNNIDEFVHHPAEPVLNKWKMKKAENKEQKKRRKNADLSQCDTDDTSVFNDTLDGQMNDIPTQCSNEVHFPEEPPHQTSDPPPAVSASGCPVREKRKTWKLLEMLPKPPEPIPDPPISAAA
ncbi:hypothetical protein BT96DRAFT_1000040 [Gymnopus androsaceus JB14]|uniref:Uncharacterized protein n=1 Tax=Gymnopus androsaceus JB14 TaxID=1447944 RepID=A0A6A4H3G5_9AGAR|nr:hypothetical protein BT96DRAFT_1000040 [Gymnopus androsaceus JB14]